MSAAAVESRREPLPLLLQDRLLSAAERRPGEQALVAHDRSGSYQELAGEALALARALQDLGLERGGRVAIQLDNSWACAVAIYATLIAGGVFVLVNPQVKPGKLSFILADCEATALVAENRLARAFLDEGGARKQRTLLIARGASGEGTLSLEELIASTVPAPHPSSTIPLDLAALIYTSGSTGQPKGVMMTHQSMVFAAESISRYLRLDAHDRILCFLPFSFDYGLYQLLMSVHVGGTLLVERSFTFPPRVLELARLERATVFPGVPTVYATLLALGEEIVLPGIETVTNTAAALPPEHVSRLRKIFPNARIYLMYGLTECKRVSYLEPELIEARPGSVGKAIPGTEAFVLTAAGEPAKPGEVGILHVRGPHVMQGYWRRSDLSAEMLREGELPGERVLCTQDWFKTDEEGFLYFVGRSDDIIKTGGEKVSPAEVESALCAIEGVAEAAVVGEPDELLGEAICAYLVLAPSAELEESDVKRLARARLESFMVPSRMVFVSELPRTDTGKVRKKSLAAAPRGERP
jgi:long-chain acyl-CoA synthetase